MAALGACGDADRGPAESTAVVATVARSATTGELEQASSSASAPPEPSAQAPSSNRRGLWIWDFERNAPPPERAAALAAEWGVGRVFLKGSNGRDGARWRRNASSANLAPFLARGIEVWIFGYFYATDVPDADGRTWGTLDEQVAAAVASAGQPGVTGFVVDAEEEFKDRAADAESLCRKLRASLGGKKLAYTSYGWIRANRRFPFKTFDRYCGDAFLPQVYYAFGWPGDVAGSLDRLDQDLASLGLTAPVWPVQSNERAPSAARLNAFFERAGPDASVFYLHPEGSAQTAELTRVSFR